LNCGFLKWVFNGRLSTGLFFNFCLFAAKHGGSTGAGAYSALFFFYLMAQMMALIMYAIFF